MAPTRLESRGGPRKERKEGGSRSKRTTAGGPRDRDRRPSSSAAPTDRALCVPTGGRRSCRHQRRSALAAGSSCQRQRVAHDREAVPDLHRQSRGDGGGASAARRAQGSAAVGSTWSDPSPRSGALPSPGAGLPRPSLALTTGAFFFGPLISAP